MTKTKPSFFERLTGAVKLDDDDSDDRNDRGQISGKSSARAMETPAIKTGSRIDESAEEGELTVDVYQNNDTIFIKAMIAGVRPEDLDINISRDLVTIRGKREEERLSSTDDYFIRELYWGSFSRTVSLPEEIDVDESEAIEKHGLLILRLPKLDKKRQSKLKVKTI
jgi:HSP20 family molecular chaperone IbpA